MAILTDGYCNNRYYYRDDKICVQWNKYLRKWMIVSPESDWQGVKYSAMYISQRSPSAKQLANRIKASWK